MATNRSFKPEWPTIGLIAATYAVLAFVLIYAAVLPWWVIMPLGSYAAALHSSLQHEVLHGHPTRSRLVNEMLVFLTPTFWMPYHRYRDTHLQHHNDEHITCPVNDPESYYLLPDAWAEMPGLKRALFICNQTLFGRMVLGPAISICRFWSAEFYMIAKGDRRRAKHWAIFVAACAVSYLAISSITSLPFWTYYLLIAYPGISLALIRSYCEHQAAENVGERTIIVEASPVWSLLFLYNNLHIAHHTRPAIPWYRLPAYYAAERENLIRKNNGYLMKGYGEIFRRYLFKPKESIPHPNVSWLKRPNV